MKDEWLDYSTKLAQLKADFYSGCRKILQGHLITFKHNDETLQLEDCGFTKSKMSMLTRNYLHDESRAVALKLWKKRVESDKYGSVGFTTYNHFVKGNVSGASPRGSVFGPCIQSVTLTYEKKGKVSVDVFYRTTEFFKKFPADLVFIRDVLLPPFKLGPNVKEMRFHFANITCHPMYAVTLLPSLEDPEEWLEDIKHKDKYFYDWIVKWTARYVCPEYMRGIQKFSQAMRVRKDALERIDKDTLKYLQKYLRKNHPGYRGDYDAGDDE